MVINIRNNSIRTIPEQSLLIWEDVWFSTRGSDNLILDLYMNSLQYTYDFCNYLNTITGITLQNIDCLKLYDQCHDRYPMDVNKMSMHEHHKCRIVSGCPSQCTCYGSAGYQHVDCSGQHMVDFPTYLPNMHSSSLLIMNLSNNNISKVSTQYYSIRLSKLDLTNNAITYIPYDIFDMWTNLQLLFLSHNHIETIEDLSLKGMGSFINTSINQMTLEDNPWNCNCRNLDLVEMLIKYSNRFDDVLSYTCNTPDDTKGNPLLKVVLARFCDKEDALLLRPWFNALVIFTILLILIIITIGLWYSWYFCCMQRYQYSPAAISSCPLFDAYVSYFLMSII